MTVRRTATQRWVGGLGVTEFRRTGVADSAPDAGERADEPSPVVLIVHGAMDRAGGFVRTVRHLDDDVVVAYDRRGYATSRELAPSSHLATQVDDLFAIIDDLDGPVTVVGHSQGALIALHAAVRVSNTPTPARSRAMAHLASVAAWEPPLPWHEWYDRASPQAVHDIVDGVTSPRDVAETFMRSVLSDELWERLPPAMRDDRLSEGPALVADITASRRPDARLDLTNVDIPLVVGFGTATSSQHRRSAEVVADEVAGARLIAIEGATHGVHLGDPLAFASFIVAARDAATAAR